MQKQLTHVNWFFGLLLYMFSFCLFDKYTLTTHTIIHIETAAPKKKPESIITFNRFTTVQCSPLTKYIQPATAATTTINVKQMHMHIMMMLSECCCSGCAL